MSAVLRSWRMPREDLGLSLGIRLSAFRLEIFRKPRCFCRILEDSKLWADADQLIWWRDSLRSVKPRIIFKVPRMLFLLLKSGEWVSFRFRLALAALKSTLWLYSFRAADGPTWQQLQNRSDLHLEGQPSLKTRWWREVRLIQLSKMLVHSRCWLQVTE